LVVALHLVEDLEDLDLVEDLVDLDLVEDSAVLQLEVLVALDLEHLEHLVTVRLCNLALAHLDMEYLEDPVLVHLELVTEHPVLEVQEYLEHMEHLEDLCNLALAHLDLEHLVTVHLCNLALAHLDLAHLDLALLFKPLLPSHLMFSPFSVDQFN